MFGWVKTLMYVLCAIRVKDSAIEIGSAVQHYSSSAANQLMIKAFNHTVIEIPKKCVLCDYMFTRTRSSVYETTRSKVYGVNLLPCNPEHAMLMHDECAYTYLTKYKMECPICSKPAGSPAMLNPFSLWKGHLKQYPALKHSAALRRHQLESKRRKNAANFYKIFNSDLANQRVNVNLVMNRISHSASSGNAPHHSILFSVANFILGPLLPPLVKYEKPYALPIEH